MASMMKIAVLGFRFILPYTIQAAFFTFRLMLTALASLWVGVPNACSAIAMDWQMRAIRAGFPTLYCDHLYYAIYAVALITIVSGWVILAFLTTAIFRWLVF